jgi:hypothetical protein
LDLGCLKDEAILGGDPKSRRQRARLRVELANNAACWPLSSLSPVQAAQRSATKRRRVTVLRGTPGSRGATTKAATGSTRAAAADILSGKSLLLRSRRLLLPASRPLELDTLRSISRKISSLLANWSLARFECRRWVVNRHSVRSRDGFGPSVSVRPGWRAPFRVGGGFSATRSRMALLNA